jgi:hypothetical protein
MILSRQARETSKRGRSRALKKQCTTCFGACNAGDRCFDRCPGGASNSSSPCWIACYYNTMLGPKSSTGFGGPSSSFLKGHMPIPALQTVRVSPSSSLSPLHTHFLYVSAACFTHSWCGHALDHQDRLGTASQPCGSAVPSHCIAANNKPPHATVVCLR